MTAGGEPDPGRAPAVAVDGLTVRYDGAPVVDGVSLTVAHGQVVALLGPSGSGKTTLLSAIAGFLAVDAGEIRIGGELVAGAGVHRPPERRACGVVFQSYALWPHLRVAEIVAYPLRRAGIGRDQAAARAMELLGRLGIAHLAARRPTELSGGEQQRVALGRALARDPRLYLFDEPTAHLDAPLRARLQAELAEHRRRSGAAALYATHDTAEALALADRVALLRAGRIVQVGTPQAVYERPVDRRAAELTGPAAVVDLAVVAPATDRSILALGGVRVDVALGGERPPAAGPVQVLVRPDWVSLGGPLRGQVELVAFRGPHTDVHLATAGGTIGIRIPGPPTVAPGAWVGWSLERAWLLPAAGPPSAGSAR